MSPNPRLALISSLLLTLSVSCREVPESQVKTELSGSAENTANGAIGQAYRSETNTLVVGKGCVKEKGKADGAEQGSFAGESSAEVRADVDLSFEQVVDEISGGLNAGAKFGIFSVEGAGDYASREASDDFSSTISLIGDVRLKRKVAQELELTEFGKSVIGADGQVKENVYNVCGDEFVSQITYGAKLFINTKFRFESAQDKEEFKGKASVSLAAIGELGGQMSKLSDRLKRTTKITISARQIGGDVSQLSQVIHSGIFSCNLAEFDQKCLPMLVNLSDYANTTFKDSLKNANLDDPKGWAQLVFTTSKYSDANITNPANGQKVELVHNRSSLISREIRFARDEVYEAYEKELLGYQRASDMLKDSNLTAVQRSDLKAVQTASGDNKRKLAEIGKICSTQPSECIPEFEHYKKTAKIWNERSLSLKTCLVASDVEGTTWEFSRSNNTPIGVIRLAANGKIELAVSDADVSWKVEGCLLRFYNKFGSHTSTFDDIQSIDMMTGVYYFNGSFRHILKRLDPESDTVKKAEQAWKDANRQTTVSSIPAMAAGMRQMMAEIERKGGKK